MASPQVTLIRREIKKFTDTILAEAIADAVDQIVTVVETRLTAKIAALESKLAALAFKGPWTEGRRYCERNLVSMGGAIYYCQTDNTDARPGVGTPEWSLLVPKARDGRDAPEPRTARSNRSTPLPAVSVVRDNR
jgi:hypothetical protein